MNIGKAVRYLREKKRLTQEELAYRAGVMQGNISGIERGIQGYSQETLEGLAVGLGVRVSEIFMTAEELLGMPIPNGPSTHEEEALLANFRAMEPTARYHIEEISAALAQQDRLKKAAE